mgnify:FL=1
MQDVEESKIKVIKFWYRSLIDVHMIEDCKQALRTMPLFGETWSESQESYFTINKEPEYWILSQ